MVNATHARNTLDPKTIILCVRQTKGILSALSLKAVKPKNVNTAKNQVLISIHVLISNVQLKKELLNLNSILMIRENANNARNI